MENIDHKTVAGFGDEWTRYDQSKLANEERKNLFQYYFLNFPWDKIKTDAEGADIGCGSGRWAFEVAPRVGKLHCVDASIEALAVAKKNLKTHSNCYFYNFGVEKIPFKEASLDFAYSLGVLHHVPDTEGAIRSCAKILKPGAPFLLYLYYRFDNRPQWFRIVWKISNLFRIIISKLPFSMRSIVCGFIAYTVYWPLSRTARILAKIGFNTANFPLESYKNVSLYTLKTDALDRFGTRLEQRFTKDEIEKMLINSNFERISFNSEAPFWCALAYKK